MSAIALPVSLPPYQAWMRDLMEEIHGMETGVPDWVITIVEGLAEEMEVIRRSMWPGRDMVVRSEPSVSQSYCGGDVSIRIENCDGCWVLAG